MADTSKGVSSDNGRNEDVESDSEAGSNEDETPQGMNMKRIIIIIVILYFICLCLVFIIILAVAIASGLIYDTKLTIPPNTGPFEQQKAIAECKKIGKQLPKPIDEESEREIIDELKMHHDTLQCQRYYLGLILDPKIRYETMNGEETYPSSLGSDKSMFELNDDSDCVLPFSYKNERPVRTKCRHVKKTSCLMAAYSPISQYKKKCLRSMIGACVMYHSRISKKTLITKYRSLRRTKKITGMYIVDPDNIPTRLQEPTAGYECWASMRYVFEFLDVDTNDFVPYEPIDYVVTDPEAACLVVDSKQDFKMTGVDCSEKGCAVCGKDL